MTALTVWHACCAAPEIVSNRKNYDGKMVDVWSAGVMLYVMLFCQYPFERSEDDKEKVPAKRYQTVCPLTLCVVIGNLSAAYPRCVLFVVLKVSAFKLQALQRCCSAMLA